MNRLLTYLFVVSFALNHALAFNAGVLFLMPYDLFLYFSIIIWIANGFRLVNASWPFYLFIGSLILQLIFGWIRGTVELSQLIQKMLFYVGTISVFASIKKEHLSFVLKTIGTTLFFSLFVIVVLEEIGFSPIKSLGIINIHGQSFRYFGLHNERLYLSELMIIGGVGMSINKGRSLNFILFIVFVISALNQSFTGMIQVILLSLLRGSFSLKNVLGISIMGIIIGVIYANGDQFFPGIQGVNFALKVEQYTEAPEESFRYLTNLALLEHYFSHPTIFGYGMNANVIFVADLVGQSLAATSHSLIYHLHDGGTVGILIGLFFLIHLAISTKRSFNDNLDDSLWMVTFFVLTLTRMLFYFHPYLPIYYLFAAVYASKARK